MLILTLTGSLIYDLFLILAAFITCSYLKFKFYLKYKWKRLNIPYIEPTFLLGNTSKVFFFESVSDILKRHYIENRDKPLLGIWFYRIPLLLVQNVSLAKSILVKDFEHFHDRSLFFTGEQDPLGEHLIRLSGTKWRKLRAKLTPIFTSGKIKMMFPLILECGKELEEFLKEPAENEETIEWKDILARYTTDITTSCAFGIKTNSLKNPGEPFLKYGKKVISPGIVFAVYYYLLSSVEFLQKILPFSGRPKEVTEFFLNAVKETIEYREKNNIKRNDFMDMLIQLENQRKLEDAHKEVDNNNSGDTEFTIETAAAQAFIFFLAGFETSSTTMLFTLYELAKNPYIQKKLQEEIDEVLAKYDHGITYEAIHEMEYLDCVINEAMRKYPSAPYLPRTCTKDYTFPGTNVKINKGTNILIPIIGIQNDPQYYPDPEKFDPGRFTAEERSKRDKFLHLPFGEGPRMCIGKRFGMTFVKTGLIFILSKYKVDVSETTQIPVKMDPTSTVVMTTHKGINLKITTRKK